MDATENATLEGIIIKRKTRNEDISHHNFRIMGELTVEITLAEYRELITNAVEDHNRHTEVLREKWKLEEVVKEKEKEIERLKEKLSDIVNMYAKKGDDEA